MTEPTPTPIGVVLPIRAFRQAFTRLAGTLSEQGRATLAVRLAERVAAACAALPVAVVTSDAEVRAWAAGHDFATVDDPGSLSEAAEAGRRYWADRGALRIVVVHADLHRIRTLAPVLAVTADVVVVPCHREDGTPVLVVSATEPFGFAYGPGSFAAHQRAAAGRSLEIVRDVDLAADVDTPEDLAALDPELLADLA